MSKAKLERVTITIPQPVLAAADALAHRLDRSRSWVLAEAVRRMVGSEEVSPGRIADICRALLRTESRFLVTGSVAQQLRDQVATAGRIELLVRRDLENAVRVLAGLEEVGYPATRDWLPERLLEQPATLVTGTPTLLLYSALGGGRYDEVEERAGHVVTGGVRIPIISPGDLQQLEPVLRRAEP